jgi:acetamidase/formamidase
MPSRARLHRSFPLSAVAGAREGSASSAATACSADEHGYTRQQAYTICSVAVDLKVSEVVDVPNFVVSASLPLVVFE